MNWHLKECQKHSNNPPTQFHPCIFLCSQSCHLFSQGVQGFDYLFVCFSDKFFFYPLCLTCASRDCLQAPRPLCMRISPKELFSTMMLAKTNHLIMAGLWVFLNASVFRSRLGQILVWECVCRNTYGTIQHCYLSSTCLLLVLFSSRRSLVIFGCEFCRAGTRPFLAFGKFIVSFNRFLLLHVFWKSEKNALLPSCPNTARSVQSSLVTKNFFFIPKKLPYFTGFVIMLKHVSCC